MTVDAEIADAWFWLEKRERRALLALCLMPPDLETCRWRDFSIDQRTAIVRTMRELADLTLACADALDLARAALNDPDPTTLQRDVRS